MSGNVVPATGDVQFLSNASSNAVCQVFGLGSNSSFSSLVGLSYNPNVNTLYTNLSTIPALSSLSLRFFAGTSLFLTSPNIPTISSITTSGITPVLSGGSGNYYVALGTTEGGSNLLNWVPATSATAISATLIAGTSYYISAFTSNLTTTTKSRVVRNSTVYTPLAAPVIANFSTFPSRNTQTLTVNWGAVTGATVYDILIGGIDVSRNITTTSHPINISSYSGNVKSLTVQSRNAINTSSASSPLEFFLTTTPDVATSVTFTRSTKRSIVAIGGTGAAQNTRWTLDNFTGDGSGGPGGITARDTTENLQTLYYQVGGGGGILIGGGSYFNMIGSGPGPGGNGGGQSGGQGTAYAGGGAGYTMINRAPGADANTNTADLLVLAGGGGGGGGGLENVNITLGTFQNMIMAANPGGRGGSGAGANGPETARTVAIRAVETIDVYGYGGGGASLSNVGFASTSNVGGVTTNNYQSMITYFTENGNSFFPANGTSAGAGGKGGFLTWFMRGGGGGGGAGYRGGGGGSVFGQATNDSANSGRYRFIMASGGGGGGSGHFSPTYTTAITGTAPTTHEGTSGQSGLVFIAERLP